MNTKYCLVIITSFIFFTLVADPNIKKVKNNDLKRVTKMVNDICSDKENKKNYSDYFHSDNMMIGTDAYTCIVLKNDFILRKPVVEYKKSHPFNDIKEITISITVEYKKLAEFNPYTMEFSVLPELYLRTFEFIKDNNQYKIISETYYWNELIFYNNFDKFIKQEKNRKRQKKLKELRKKINEKLPRTSDN